MKLMCNQATTQHKRYEFGLGVRRSFGELQTAMENRTWWPDWEEESVATVSDLRYLPLLALVFPLVRFCLDKVVFEVGFMWGFTFCVGVLFPWFWFSLWAFG